MKKIIIDNTITIFYALLIALLIRSFFFQPFYIPSSSMEPNLLVGDRFFATKFTYGFSRHSFPFSPNLFKDRFLPNKPKRGDVIVFKTPADNRTDYIKRLIGLPKDVVQIINGDLYLNEAKVKKNKINSKIKINCGENIIDVDFYNETLPNGLTYLAAYNKKNTMLNTDKFIVPLNHYFFMGDNRDCSKDSRYLSSVGYVHFDNLVGKASIIFFSTNSKEGNFFNFFRWSKIIRIDRLLKRVNEN